MNYSEVSLGELVFMLGWPQDLPGLSFLGLRDELASLGGHHFQVLAVHVQFSPLVA
jgi:hypothetical protein